jgi:LacI family transcriptional regulator
MDSGRPRPAPTARKDIDVSRKRASIHDVAQRADVSIKTVSRVLNHEPNVSQATRGRVMEAVTELSYRPNIFARGLASVRSFLIGMLYDNPSASYVASLQLGAIGACREEGYHLIVEALDKDDPKLGQSVHSLLTESMLHGVIVTPPLCDSPAVIEALQRAGTPFVLIAPGAAQTNTPYVSFDERLAAYEMTAYLIELGHRRIGFIKGHPDHGAAIARLAGYQDALKAAGISFDPDICVEGQFSYESGMQAAEKLIGMSKRPSAIFASNDDMAAAVLATAQRFNVRTPDQLSVAGFDDSEISRVVWPNLTTVRQPISEMAAAAVSMLIQNIEQGDRRLKHELIPRASTAPPEKM